MKIKPKRGKTKRRGNRLIVSCDDGRVVYLAQPDGQLRVIEAAKAGLQLTVSNHGQFAMAKGVWDDHGIQLVMADSFFGQVLAFRETDDEPRLFLNPEDPDRLFVSTSECGIANAALKLSLAE
jgi:hypothetical protein